MKTSTKTILCTLFATVCFASLPVSAQACGGRGGISRARSAFGIASRTPFSRPTQHRVVSPTRSYSSHVSTAPVHSYQPSSTIYSQPVYSQPTFANPVVSRPVQQASVPVQTIQRSAPTIATHVGTSTAVTSTQQPAQQVTRPAAPSATSAQPATTARQSALAMLASLNKPTTPAVEQSPSIPQFTPAPTTGAGSSVEASHVGTWTVTLPGNQSVALSLRSESTFTWTATKDGKQSSFTGQYRLDGEQLTLVRSSDLQQMIGSWKANDTGFAFQLQGQDASALNFQKS